MRGALIAIAAMIVIGIIACGGDGGAAAPLTLEQRLIQESEAPGSKPDPQETRVEAPSLDEFLSSPEYVRASADIDRSKLEEAGFVSAVHDTRFYPTTPGATHTGHESHVRILVIRFGSEDGARQGGDLLYEHSTEPCPGSCAQRITEFEVSEIPDAKGVRHLTSAAELEATGEPGDPFEAYVILFTDGSFAYELEAFGPPGEVSEEQLEEIAGKVYERVRGAPAPPSP